ncbi:MAG: hypothetical protein IIT61_01090 [Bacteroidales bacterium]|nr:hypothetical protein [Bacteroidales bacterium]
MLKRQYYISRLAEDIRRCRENGTDTAAEIRISRRKFICNCINQLMYDKPYVHAGFSIEPMIERLKSQGIADEKITIKPRREYEIDLGETKITIKMRFDSRYGQISKMVLQEQFDEIDISDKNPDDIADIIVAIGSSYADWNSEWDSIADEAMRLSKKQDVERISLETLIASKLKGSGIEYMLEHKKTKSTLTVKVGNRKLSMDISHRRLVETCVNLLPTIRDAMEKLNAITDEISIEPASTKDIWTKS